MEHPADRSEHECPQEHFRVVAFLTPKEMVEGFADPFLPVPGKAVQLVPDRMVRMPVGKKVDGLFDDLLVVDPVILVKIQMDVVQVIVRERGIIIFPFPSEASHDVDPVREQVVLERSFEKRVICYDRVRVPDRRYYLLLLVEDQEFHEFFPGHVRIHCGQCRKEGVFRFRTQCP